MFDKKSMLVYNTILLICISFFCYVYTPVTAKNIDNDRYELAKRQLKLGNSYRENKNYNKASEYINLAMNTFSTQRNFEEKYWYAVANEYISYLYRDKDDYNQANYYMAVADGIYSEIIKQEDGSPIITSGFKYLNNKNTINNDESNINDILYLNGQKLTQIPTNVNTKNVKYVTLANNKFKEFPTGIFGFEKIEVLDISNNRIALVPPLMRLTNLKELDLSNNRIKTFTADAIKELKLERLNLYNNKSLKTIGDLSTLAKSLKVLDIRETKIPAQEIISLVRQLPNTLILYNLVQTKKTNSNFLNFNDVTQTNYIP